MWMLGSSERGIFFFFYISLEPMSLDNLKPPECCQQTGWMAQLNTMKVNKDKCKLLCWTVIILYIQSKKGNQLDLGWGKDEEVLTSGNWAQLGKEPTLLWCIRRPAIEGRRRGSHPSSTWKLSVVISDAPGWTRVWKRKEIISEDGQKRSLSV